MENKSNSNNYFHVFTPLNIGPVTIPNRIVWPAWILNYANDDGSVSEKLTTFYTDLARGGCGMVVTGCAVVSDEGVPFKRVMRADSDDYIPGLKDLFNAIRAEGAVSCIQLVHYGRQSSTSVSGDVLMAPSAIPCPVMSQYDPQYKVREMTVDDIHTLRDHYIDAAERVIKAGVDVVEIHATHGYMLNEFLSPYSNKRTDQYGGSVENRCRIIVEIIKGIRQRISSKNGSKRYALTIRVNGDEYVEGGLKPEDYKDIAPLLEHAGVDMISVSHGVYQSMEYIVPPKKHGIAAFTYSAETVKKYTSLPVCTVGSILTLAAADQILAGGKVDLVAMGRAQHADPAIVRKSREGRESEIRKCIHCNACTFWTTGDPEVYCAVNPDYKKPQV